MGGTDCLAGGGAAFHHVAAVGAVIDVVALLIPGNGPVGVVGVGNGGVVDAALLAQPQGVGLTVLHALAAGHALLLIHPCHKVGADGVLGAEHLRNAQGKAGAAAAVADGGGVLKAGGLVDLVHQAVVLRPAENLIGLLLADQPVGPGVGIVDGILVEVHAHILFQMAAALAHKAAGPATGAGADGNGAGIFNQGSHLVIGSGTGIILNGAHDGHDPHKAHAGLAGVQGGHQHLQPAAGVFLKAGAQVGVLVALLPVGQNALHDAGHPDGVVVADLSIHLALTGHAGHHQLIQLLLDESHVLFAAPGQFFRRAVGLQPHVHHHVAHIVIHNGGQNAVLRVFVGNAGIGHALQTDLGSQLQYVRSVYHIGTSLCIAFCSKSRYVKHTTNFLVWAIIISLKMYKIHAP